VKSSYVVLVRCWSGAFVSSDSNRSVKDARHRSPVEVLSTLKQRRYSVRVRRRTKRSSTPWQPRVLYTQPTQHTKYIQIKGLKGGVIALNQSPF